jgi:serine protease AprX
MKLAIKIIICCMMMLQSIFITAQVTGVVYAYRISFKNKIGSVSINDSATFLTQKALDRRHKQGLSVNVSDIPVVQAYIDSAIKNAQAFRVKNRSKWFNQIVVLTQNNNMAAVSALPFVSQVKLVGKYSGWGGRMPNPNLINNKYNNIQTTIVTKKQARGNPTYYGESYTQLKQTNTDFLHDSGFKGEGIHIAMIDMGFSKAKTIMAFDSSVVNHKYMDQWNFVRDTINVDSFSIGPISHGTDALSVIIANNPGVYVGSAPNANVSMYITEDYAFESPIEEDNWVSAAERADSIGADLINTSLGYYQFDADFSSDNYTYANDFDGKTTLIAKAHNMAVAKGIFCVSAMGNMGGNAWKYLLTPADADSTYSVGAMDSSGAFTLSMGSSSGPSADGQIKPDGIGCGVQVAVISNSTGLPVYTGGTSFSSPLLCGGIACFMQANPKLPIWEIRRLVQQSSSRFLTTSDSMGYGVPNFKIAQKLASALSTTTNNTVTIGNATEYQLFPNPAKNILIVQHTKSALLNCNYRIMDVNGKILQQNALINSRININYLPAGLYYLQLQNNTEMVCKSFVVQ